MDEHKSYSEIALNNVQTGICVITDKGTVKYSNTHAEKLIGGDIKNRHVHEVFHNSGERGHSEENCPIMSPLENGNKIIMLPDVFYKADGTGLWVEYSSISTEYSGERLIILSFTDASLAIKSKYELQEHQAKFKAVFMQALYPKFILDGTGEILEANASAKNLLGEGIENTMIFDCFSLKSVKILKDFWRRFRKSGELSEKFDLILASGPNSRKRYVFEISATPNVQDNMHLLTMVDITKEVLRQEAQGQFLAIAGHELKTPLAVINAYSDLLLRKYKEDEKANQYVGKIKEKVDLLTRLINAMVDEIKLGAEKLEFNNSEVYLNKFVENLIDEMQKTHKNYEFSVKGRIKKDKINIDPERLTQVITNLVSNAVKYSSHDKRVTIHLFEENNNMIIGIEDYGKGISKKEQNKLFNAFYRSPDAQRRKFPGLGLGLFISKKIVGKYGGEIWLKSKWNKGSTFFISLPRK